MNDRREVLVVHSFQNGSTHTEHGESGPPLFRFFQGPTETRYFTDLLVVHPYQDGSSHTDHDIGESVPPLFRFLQGPTETDLISRSFYNHFIFYIIYANIFILTKLCCSDNMSSYSLHIGARSIIIL